MAAAPAAATPRSAAAAAPNAAPAVTVEASAVDFAGKAKLLQSNNNNWIDVERKKKKIKPVTGTGEASILVGVEKPKRDFWEIAVSRLKEGTTEDQVKTHLHGKGIEVKEIFVFPSKIKGTVSAKVRVVLAHKDRALDETNWPPHLRISSWTNKPRILRKNGASTQHAPIST